MCSLIDIDTNADGYLFVSFAVQDSESGLASLVLLKSENANVNFPSFSVGTTDPVSVVGTQISQADWFCFVFRATDVDGNETICDLQPVLLMFLS